MKNMTAVEWLQEALEGTILTNEQVMQTIGLFEQAKEMERKQINPDNEECNCFRLGEGSEWQTYLCKIHE